MFWKKKEEDKGLPDLPPVKPIFRDNTPLADIPEEPVERHALPTFPDTPISSKFSEAAIKEAVEEKESPEEEAKEESMPESEAKKPERHPIIRELEEAPKRKIAIEAKPSLKKSEDVYVKIDRFHSARKSLTAAKGKLHEINELLKKIRETRMREDQELQSWEKEIDAVKSKIEDVTSNIFEKVE